MGFGMAVLGIGLGVGILAVGAAFGIGKLAAAAMEGIARQPEAAGNIRGTAIVLAALIEGFTFFGLIVAIILGYFASQTHEATQGSTPAPNIAPVTTPVEKHN
jgi:F-type H+-transporting ATPase subunit c